jgi:hypothetical protein
MVTWNTWAKEMMKSMSSYEFGTTSTSITKTVRTEMHWLAKGDALSTILSKVRQKKIEPSQ